MLHRAGSTRIWIFSYESRAPPTANRNITEPRAAAFKTALPLCRSVRFACCDSDCLWPSHAPT